VNRASSSQLQSDLSNLYSAIAGSNIGLASWQQAESASDHAAGTLGTDIANNAGSALVLNDSAAFYDTVVSGSLAATGGSSLLQSYSSSGDTVLKLASDILSGDGAMQIQSEVAGIYNTTAAETGDPAALQAYVDQDGAANQLSEDVANGSSEDRFSNDALTTAADCCQCGRGERGRCR
jgi:hypothetical protein